MMDMAKKADITIDVDLICQKTRRAGGAYLRKEK
jgi:hypothetical protein